MTHDARPRARSDVETHVFPDASCLLFDPKAAEAHVLDAFGALVWDYYCDGALTAEEIAAEIADLLPQYEGVEARVAGLVDEFALRGLFASATNRSPMREGSG